MALWTKASLFSYITPSFRPQMARYASRFTRYELCSLLEQSLPRTPSRPISLCPLWLFSLFRSLSAVALAKADAFCAFLWLKNPRNLRNPWLINDLHASKALYICRDTFTDVMSALQIRLFMQNKPNFRKSQINVSPVNTRDYEKRTLGERGKNEPKTNPNEPN